MSSVTLERFLNDVKDHTIELCKVDGVYRDVVFSNAGSFNMRFRLVTFPGHLCYTGDMGTFVFRRVQDMFTFFRPRNGRWREEFGYWHEKLEAVDHPDGSKEKSKDLFFEVLRSYLNDWQDVADSEDDDAEAIEEYDSIRRVRAEIEEEIERLEGVYDDYGFERAYSEASEFYVGNCEHPDFTFVDLFDHSFTVFTQRFEWCCWAIQWGIVKFDEHVKEPKNEGGAGS